MIRRNIVQRFAHALLIPALLLIAMPVMVFAQDQAGGSTVVVDLLSVLGLAAAAMVIEELVDRLWNLDGVASQIRSVIMIMLVTTGLAFFKVYMFADPVVLGMTAWYIGGPVIGAVAGVMANWGFQNPVIGPLLRGLLELLKLRPQWGELGVGKKPANGADALRKLKTVRT